MIPSSRGDSNKDLQAKQEGDTINNNNEANKYAKAPSSSRQWSAFRNPRIVRVSRTFGGKDRHSKVCTVRGLRDRRIRLSVPTAIQLYDLQDRLGLNQPSKVIDWLLDATKNDIDKLPPLQMPQGFGQFHSPMLFPFHDSTSSQSNLFSSNLFDPNNHSSFLKFGGLDEGSSDKGKWVRTMEEENYGGQVSAHKLFPLTTGHSSSSSSLPSGLLGNPNPNPTPMPFGSYYHLDASNLSLAQLGSHGILSQPESSSLPNNNGAHQMLFCPQPATLPSLFPAYSPFASSAMESESRDINYFQLLSSSTSQTLLQSHHLRPSNYPVRPFSLSVNPVLDHPMQGREEGLPHQQRDTEDS